MAYILNKSCASDSEMIFLVTTGCNGQRWHLSIHNSYHHEMWALDVLSFSVCLASFSVREKVTLSGYEAHYCRHFPKRKNEYSGTPICEMAVPSTPSGQQRPPNPEELPRVQLGRLAAAPRYRRLPRPKNRHW